jgi:hypothetical protein
MFPFPSARQVSTALLELADAMLRPLPTAEPLERETRTPATPSAGTDRAADASAATPAFERDGDTARFAHPHRRPARIVRRRRPGALSHTAQHCISPLPRRATTPPAPAPHRFPASR